MWTAHLPTARRRVALAAVATLVSGAALAGCGDSGPDDGARVRSADTDVSFAGCDKVACKGEINGAAYEIVLPQKWNGTLVLYSHGYRQAEPAPPDFTPVDRTAVPAPGEEVGRKLLEQGYALAGSAYRSNGWAVQEGVQAGEELYAFFRDKVGRPDRVYLWGDSLGGLITQTLAEKELDWVSGALPMCGVLGGTNSNLDLAMDVAYAVKTLLYPSLKLTGYASHDEAARGWQGAYDAIVKAGSDVKNGVPRILMVASLADAPNKTKTYDGASIESAVRAYAEAVLTALGYGTYGRHEIEKRVGGNPSGNTDTDYAARISDGERQLLELVSKGSTDRLLAELERGERVSADAAARAKADALGNPTGALAVPTITLHTTADPLVLVQNERLFASRVNAAKDRSGDLVQLYSQPPATYPREPGAPYGAGHCNFSTEQRLAALKLLDDWVRAGIYPGSAALTGAASMAPGLVTQYVPGPWPAEAAG